MKHNMLIILIVGIGICQCIRGPDFQLLSPVGRMGEPATRGEWSDGNGARAD
jgi:hypothetical protein